MRPFALSFMLAVAITACAPADESRGSAMASSAGGAAESTPTATRPASPDTSATKVTVTTTSAAVLGDSVLKRDSIIGRDSAFGPKFRIDSTGKLVRIRRP